jgi:hypothetical protein
MKLREVRLLAEAVDDLAQGRSFYDAQQPGVGDYFVESVLGDLAVLRLHAGIHRRVYGFHRLLCLRFPFAAYYDISAVGVRVAAVLDMRRNPTWIRESLGKRKRTIA